MNQAKFYTLELKGEKQYNKIQNLSENLSANARHCCVIPLL